MEEIKSRYGDVYITRYGEKYHNYYHYEDRNHDISLYDAFKSGYDACNVCSPREMPNFKKLESDIPWPIKHWFISLILFTVIYIYIYFRWKENK